MIVLDTNLLRYLQEPDHPFGKIIRDAATADPDQDRRITAVTVAEGIKGVYEFFMKGQQQRRDMIDAHQKVVDVVESFVAWRGKILPFDAQSLAIFRAFPARRPPMKAPDARIAAIALRHGARVWTRNLADFADFPGLVVFDPIGKRSNFGAN